MSMFGKSGNKKESQENINARNHIAQGTTMKGTLVSSGGLRIDGNFEGDITAEGKFIIGEKGFVKGNIECNDAEIEGTINGNIIGKGLIYMKASSVFDGDMKYGDLKTDPGVAINGHTTKLKDGKVTSKPNASTNGQAKPNQKVAAKSN
ncbi:MAG: bactofilin family protein [Bacteroidia bacterium]